MFFGNENFLWSGSFSALSYLSHLSHDQWNLLFIQDLSQVFQFFISFYNIFHIVSEIKCFIFYIFIFSISHKLKFRSIEGHLIFIYPLIKYFRIILQFLNIWFIIYFCFDSSTYILVFDFTFSPIFALYIRNNKEPRTMPWGTPDITSQVWDFLPFTSTTCFLPVKMHGSTCQVFRWSWLFEAKFQCQLCQRLSVNLDKLNLHFLLFILKHS